MIITVLGLDPGTSESGWLVWDTVAHEIVPTKEVSKRANLLLNRDFLKGKDDNNLVATVCMELAANPIIDVVGIEMFAGYGRSVGRSTFEACKWVGRFEQIFISRFKPVRMIYRKGDVCPWICRTTMAKDKDIRAALIERYGEPGTKKKPGKLYGVTKDMWSALAIAITTVEKYNSARKQG